MLSITSATKNNQTNVINDPELKSLWDFLVDDPKIFAAIMHSLSPIEIYSKFSLPLDIKHYINSIRSTTYDEGSNFKGPYTEFSDPKVWLKLCEHIKNLDTEKLDEIINFSYKPGFINSKDGFKLINNFEKYINYLTESNNLVKFFWA